MTPPNNILILTYWGFNEALIQSYTLPYLRLIRAQLPPEAKIHLVTLEKSDVTITEDPDFTHIPLQYAPFGGKGFLQWFRYIRFLKKYMRRESVETIHAWCTTPGMIGYILSKLTGKPLVLDSFEPHAEAMVENGEWPRKSAAFRLLFKFEKLQAKRSVAQLCAASGMREYSKNRLGVTLSNPFVKPACVDLDIFQADEAVRRSFRENVGLTDEIVGIYAGKLGGIYLRQELFDFAAVCAEKWGAKFRLLLLTNASQEEIVEMCRHAGFPEEQCMLSFVPFKDVPAYLNCADFAITPVKPVPTKRYCTPIKDGEYWAMGLPVVITKDISDDSDIIAENNAGYVLQELTKEEYSNAADTVGKLLEEGRGSLQNRIRKLAVQYRNFDVAKSVYREIYGRRIGEEHLKN